ncbi:hypothetical protein FSP39_022755 [Pinctada imbricata]|uniref:Uncharacterized protein n=1 Tax=Pinctada imbricata TaxID=66713 RepID=A0AA89C765_PINIB|nr:hypothetical protein FSP39_022755 [Pinctada imbricata]
MIPNQVLILHLETAKRARGARKPRSLMEIRESLRQMMEAEVIAIQQERLKKELGSRAGVTKKSKKGRKQQKALSDITGAKSKSSSMNSLFSLPNLNNEQNRRKQEETRTSNTPIQDNESTDSKSSKKSNTKPVLVTELNKKDADLPSIIEERTQEEIILRGGTERREFQSKTVFTGNIASQKSTLSDSTNSQLRQKSDVQMKSMEDVKTLIGEENTKGGKENVKLPNIQGSGQGETDPSQASKWNIPMKFVNENIEKRLTNRDSDELLPDFEDYESNEANLSFLEDRLMSFHIRYGGQAKAGMKLPKLARFKVGEKPDEELKLPKPGGKVWVRKRLCQFSDNKIQVKDHRHVRHHIVPEIPDFEQVTKAKQVMQPFLDVTANK